MKYNHILGILHHSPAAHRPTACPLRTCDTCRVRWPLSGVALPPPPGLRRLTARPGAGPTLRPTQRRASCPAQPTGQQTEYDDAVSPSLSLYSRLLSCSGARLPAPRGAVRLESHTPSDASQHEGAFRRPARTHITNTQTARGTPPINVRSAPLYYRAHVTSKSQRHTAAATSSTAAVMPPQPVKFGELLERSNFKRAVKKCDLKAVSPAQRWEAPPPPY